MNKKLYQCLCLLLVLAMLPCFGCAEQTEDYSPWLWFIRGGEAPESTGSGVVLWYKSQYQTSFRQDMIPEDRLPTDSQDVGYVLIAQQGNSSLVGFYSNGASGLRYSVDIIAFNAATGTELERKTVYGGDPPNTTTSTSMEIYGSWPKDEDVAQAVIALCEELPAEVAETPNPWRYVIRTENDKAAILAEYTRTEEEALAYLVFDPGVEILGYDGYEGGVLTIPDEIDGLPVVAIGKDAFSDKSKFSAIILPETVTRLGECAFDYTFGCQINLPDGITVIPYLALNAHYDFSHWPAGLKAIGYNGCSNTMTAAIDTLPEGIEYIGTCAFSGSFILRSLTLPRSVQKIAFDAFAGCDDLTLYVYQDSYAYSFLAEGGWEAAVEEYAEWQGMRVDDVNWCEKPAFQVIEE